MSREYYRLYFLSVLLTLVCWSTAWASDDRSCAGAAFSDVNTTLHHAGGASCFVTYVPSAGLLMLEVDIANSALAEPWLEFHNGSCTGAGANLQPLRYSQQFARSALVEIRQAGEYYFCVAAQDPSQVLDEYRIVNGFAPASFYKTNEDEHEPEPDPLVYVPGCGSSAASGLLKTNEDEHEPEPDPLVYVPGCGSSAASGLLKTNEDEHEPEPDPLVYVPGCGSSAASGLLKTNEDEHEPEPDPLVYVPGCGSSAASGLLKTNEDEHEPEPDPLVYVPCQEQQLPLVERLCRQNRTDDHSSAFRCATSLRLGTEIDAELGDSWGEDRDLFTFVVGEMTRVRIETAGDSDTLGGLYDQNGYRLKVDDDGGDETNFRIVKTLSPGRYYARVEGGHDTEGAYRLIVENLSSVE